MAKFVSKIDASSRLAKAVEGSEDGMVKAFLAISKVNTQFKKLVEAAAMGKSFSTDVSVSDGGIDWNVELTWNPGSKKASINVAGFDEEGGDWDSGTTNTAITKAVGKAIKEGDLTRGVATYKVGPIISEIDKLIRAIEKYDDKGVALEDDVSNNTIVDRLEKIKVRLRKAKKLTDVGEGLMRLSLQLVDMKPKTPQVQNLVKKVKTEVNAAHKILRDTMKMSS